MDLTIQPPRRPSNRGMAGIVGLARMTDKARAHNVSTLGAYLYGEDSGLDREVLAFIGMDAAEYAEATARLGDRDLSELALERARKTPQQIQAFNREQLERTPQDDFHRRLLIERLAKYAPGRTDIRTVFQSMELDDWGEFRVCDLTERSPRPVEDRSVARMPGLAYLADKARAAWAGRLGPLTYGEEDPMDRALLRFLGISAEEFREAAYLHPNSIELGEWIQSHTSRSKQELANFTMPEHGGNLT